MRRSCNDTPSRSSADAQKKAGQADDAEKGRHCVSYGEEQAIPNLFDWKSDRLDRPIFTEQLAVFYRWNDSEPVGYVTWALLAPDVEHRWLHDPQVLLHESEWNEGENLWIMDFLALPGYCEDIVEFIEQNMFAGYSEARSVRRNADGTVRKVSTWRRRERHSRIAGADEISTLSVE
jgi:hemolysin-activating ACP:hemolysin acyltransferase